MVISRIRIFLVLSLFFLPLAFASQKVEIESIKTGLSFGNITVEQTAIALPTTAQPGRKALIIVNNSDNTIFLGGSTVTISTGTPLYKKQPFMADVTENIVIYAISSAGNNDIRYMELR